MEIIQSTSLFFTNHTSDKVYQVQIENSDQGFLVNFAYGRRGGSLKAGTKTQAPVTLDKAEAIYQKLLKSKISKGYTEEKNGETFSSEARNDESSNFSCQLLNPIDQDEKDVLIENDNFIMQEKHDGVRLSIEYKEGIVRGINRKGLYVGISTTVAKAYESLAAKHELSSFLIDGEGLGDKHAAFDLVELNGDDLRNASCRTRFIKLLSLIHDSEKHTHDPIFITEFAETYSDKEKMFDFAISNQWEGLVFKHMDSKYEAGRPSSLGHQLKFKFYKTASIIVQSINDKRSVSMAVLDGNGKSTFAGNVTIPPNHPVPSPGKIAEVRYLYAMPSNALYQPTYLGERDDIDSTNCTLDQLEYKKAA